MRHWYRKYFEQLGCSPDEVEICAAAIEARNLRQDLDLAERGRRRVLQANKGLYNDRIKRLKTRLTELTGIA